MNDLQSNKHKNIYSDNRTKKYIREIRVEDLLFRKTVQIIDQKTKDYYNDKVILITGGGGSIGSQICRELAKMSPKKLIILDISENGAYNIAQEIHFQYKTNIQIEIATVCDRREIDKIFDKHKPEIVIHAAAHKHVPLMENNCCEAVKNNVFGTLNVVETAEKYKVKKFIQISTFIRKIRSRVARTVKFHERRLPAQCREYPLRSGQRSHQRYPLL